MGNGKTFRFFGIELCKVPSDDISVTMGECMAQGIEDYAQIGLFPKVFIASGGEGVSIKNKVMLMTAFPDPCIQDADLEKCQ